jgi:hypothetical protein
MRTVIFCLLLVGLSPLGQAQEGSRPASMPTSNPYSRGWDMPQLTKPELLQEAPPEEAQPPARNRLVRASLFTGIVGGLLVEGSWVIGATMSPQSTDIDDPNPQTPTGAIFAGGIIGGTGKTLLSSSLVMLTIARYQKTKKVRTLYAATGLVAVHTVSRLMLSAAYGFSSFGPQADFHPAKAYGFSNLIGFTSSLAVDLALLGGSIQQTLKQRKPSRELAQEPPPMKVIAPIKSLDMSGEFVIRFHDRRVGSAPKNETLLIHSDGSIELRERSEVVSNPGAEVVKNPGKITKATLSESELASIRFAFSSEAFFGLEDSYRGEMEDVPSMTFSVQTPTQKKSISVSGVLFQDLPPALQTAVVYTQKIAQDRLQEANR